MESAPDHGRANFSQNFCEEGVFFVPIFSAKGGFV